MPKIFQFNSQILKPIAISFSFCFLETWGNQTIFVRDFLFIVGFSLKV